VRAISIRQPWAWAIVHGGKRIENRSWWTAYRGPILIHASTRLGTAAEFFAAVGEVGARVAPALRASLRALTPGALPRGGVVARAVLAGVLDRDGWPTEGRVDDPSLERRWHARGSFGFVLTAVQPLPFAACEGKLGLFEVPDDLFTPEESITP
jgi:ASCH domain